MKGFFFSLLFLFLFGSLESCLLIQKGVQKLETLIFCLVGVGLLYLSFRFIISRFFSRVKPPLARFFIALGLGILIALA